MIENLLRRIAYALWTLILCPFGYHKEITLYDEQKKPEPVALCARCWREYPR